MSPKKMSKKTQKANVNINFELDNKQKKKVEKNLKKTPFKTLLIVLVVFVVFALIGGGITFVLTRNDCFELVGADEITLSLGDSFVDPGVKIVAFNKDVSANVVVKTNMQTEDNVTFSADEVGTYYIEYTVDNFKYNTLFKIKKVRLITVVEPSEGEVESMEVALG